MNILTYLDLGYSWFSKGLDVLRNIILKASSFAPGDPRTILAIVTLAVSLFISYWMTGKLVTKPLDTRYIVYYLIITWLVFTILFYFTGIGVVS